MLRKLKQLWYQRLKDEGFIDIETDGGALKSYDRRTIAFDHRQRILEFYLELDRYIADAKMDQLDRTVLMALSDGFHVTEIARMLGFSRQWITKIIKKHKINMGYHTPEPRRSGKSIILRKHGSSNTGSNT